MTSIALFDNKKMTDTISTEQSLLIQALKGLDKLSPIAIKFKEDHLDKQLFLEQIGSRVKIKGNKNLEAPLVSIDLKMEAVLVEYQGNRDFNKKDAYRKLEKEVNKHVEKKIEDLLKELQEFELDPVGFSEYFRMYHKGKWTEELTKKIITSSEYKVNVEFKVLNTGALK